MGNSPKIYLSLNPPKDLPYKEIEKSREGRTQKVLFFPLLCSQINEWGQMDRESTAHFKRDHDRKSYTTFYFYW